MTTERNRLMLKFNINRVANGSFGDGFFAGLLEAEKYYEATTK